VSVQRLPTDAIARRFSLPPEIAFLLTEGVEARLLIRAAREAAAAGTDAATALLNAGLLDETAYYRALARKLGAPYLDGPIPFGLGLRFPDSLVAGLAPLAPGSVAPCVLAPRGRLIADLLDAPHRAAMPAITSPTHLREAVFAAIPGRWRIMPRTICDGTCPSRPCRTSPRAGGCYSWSWGWWRRSACSRCSRRPSPVP
jgi:hypothetical protein